MKETNSINKHCNFVGLCNIKEIVKKKGKNLETQKSIYWHIFHTGIPSDGTKNFSHRGFKFVPTKVLCIKDGKRLISTLLIKSHASQITQVLVSKKKKSFNSYSFSYIRTKCECICVFVCACACVFVCACACVCVCARDKEREREQPIICQAKVEAYMTLLIRSTHIAQFVSSIL